MLVGLASGEEVKEVPIDHARRFVFASAAPLEESIRRAVELGFARVDFNADTPANYPHTFTPDRIRGVRALLDRHGVTLGLHTLSAVNMAEITPVMAAAADEYLRQNLDLAAALGAAYAICHGGYHFGGDREARFDTALERMRRAAAWAEERDLDIYFENHNKEPDEAEIHYLPRDVAETRRFFEAIRSPRFKWAFNVGHAHLVPDGFDGFLDAFGVERIGLVLMADCRGTIEEHLLPGQGTMDFARLFARLEGDGYRGPYMLTFGNREQKIAGREYLLQKAGALV